MKKVEDAITYFEALLDRLGNGDSDNLVCATALEALREKRDRDVTGNNRMNAEMNLQEMLTEKQLQALVDCEEKEDCAGETCPMFETCDNDYTNKVAAEAAETALAYRAMLERLERECNYTCKMCNGNKHTGHKPDCELAAMLKESEGLG